MRRPRHRARLARLHRAEELRRSLRRSHDWILSLDADERVTPELAAEIRRHAATIPRDAGYRMPRLTWHLGRWIRDDRLVSGLSDCGLYDRRARALDRRIRARGGEADGSLGRLRGELQHFAYRDIADHLETIDRYTTLRRAPDARGGTPRRRAPARRPSAAGVPAQLPREGRLPRRRRRLHHLDDERVLRVPEVREALELQSTLSASRVRATGRARYDRRETDVFSLHIDTARTWRGGQNQVLLTVNGLRAIGQRAALVAHPDGELRRRAAEGST